MTTSIDLRAQLESFTSWYELAELLDRIPRRLADYAGRELGLRDVVYKLLDAAEAEGWTGELAGALAAGPVRPGQQEAVRRLLDIATFDMQALADQVLLAQAAVGRRRVVGIAVGYPRREFARVFCDRLRMDLVNATVDPDGSALGPNYPAAEFAARRILSQRGNLNLRSIIFPVYCDSAKDATIAEFWTDLRDRLDAARHYLILILLTSAGARLPDDVTVLAPPRISELDVQTWTIRVVNALAWPPQLAVVWHRRLVDEARIDGEVDAALVFSLLGTAAERLSSPGTQRQLKDELSRALEATAAPTPEDT